MIGEYFKGSQPTLNQITNYIKKKGCKIIKTTNGTYLVDEYEDQKKAVKVTGKAIDLERMEIIDELLVTKDYIVAIETYKTELS